MSKKGPKVYGYNPPPVKQKPSSTGHRGGYNPPPVGERPSEPVVTPPPPPKKSK